jgi:hypothetical protein
MNKHKIRWCHHPRAVYPRLKEVFISCQNDIHVRDYRTTQYRSVHHIAYQLFLFYRSFRSINYLQTSSSFVHIEFYFQCMFLIFD